MKEHFLLNPEITYLNHGSFGACPKPVFDDYQKWQLELESEPVQFILKNSADYLKSSKLALAKYINCAPEDFYFTVNPTHAINTVMRSLNLQPGDEILSTDQEYGAMDRTWNFYSKKTGVKYVQSHISLPIVSKQQILDEFWSGYTDKTKVVFINQISSATALILPAAEICAKAKSLGLITIVDGAHVPGHIELDLQDLQADFYTGTLHKWMLTPKGSSFLYVHRDFQQQLEPLIVSWGYDSVAPGASRFLDYHEQQGTRDISAFLTAPAAIKFLDDHDWNTKKATCRNIVLENYPKFCALFNTEPICPVTEEFLGQMASIPVKTKDPLAVKNLLFDKYRIEIPVMDINGRIYIRYSINAYNLQADLDILFDALHDILATTNLFDA